ncbi:hypothetical protein Hesp01_58570 [Herbidospora sp. NBRC 101105]|nr:hypothetical protein Hesp01_58570 [Herbidospora sp. NBRC 101105]
MDLGELCAKLAEIRDDPVHPPGGGTVYLFPFGSRAVGTGTDRGTDQFPSRRRSIANAPTSLRPQAGHGEAELAGPVELLVAARAVEQVGRPPGEPGSTHANIPR